MRPLEDLFVVDFSTLLPGPMASLLLAEAGAEVVKIERPSHGEDMRSYNPKWGRDSVNFALLNRGKRSIALDLKQPDDLARAIELIKKADILVEQFRPGVMAKLGLDYETMRSINPRLIYCSITGYGQTGPKSNVAGHDLNYIGDTGLLALSMGQGPNPTVPPALIADIAGGAYPAVMNILLALESRRRTGAGCYLDVAMTDNLFTFMYWAIGNGLATGAWPGNGTDLVTGGTLRYRLYPTRDGRVVAAAPIEQKFWETFCDIIGLDPSLRDDGANPAATSKGIASIIAGQDADYWSARFSGVDCCCSIVLNVRDALAEPHFVKRQLFAHRVMNEKGQELPALPVPVAPTFRAPIDQPLASPQLREHGFQ